MKTATFRFERIIKLGEGINTGYSEEFYQKIKTAYKSAIGKRFKNYFPEAKADIIQNFNNRFRDEIDKFIDETSFDHRLLEIKTATFDILDFDIEKHHLNQAWIILLTDVFILLDSFNNKILLTTSDNIEKVKNREKIEDTFFVTIPENVTMAEYTPL